ncbi:hypothetical protein N9937_01505 [bacterium]|nr:hypothetical protein [bacterium]
MQVDEWARRHGVSVSALQELRALFTEPNTDAPPALAAPRSEAANSTLVRLRASREGGRLWRNNVGAGKIDDGSFLRWGLANDSRELNAKVKSSDLIGLRPVLITTDMVGSVIGQFVAREVKRSSWKYRGTDREQAQLKFLEIVAGMGGDACFINS